MLTTHELKQRTEERGGVPVAESGQLEQRDRRLSLRDREVIATFSVDDLINRARENPPDPVIDGLMFVGDIGLIHGQEESFKSVLVFQIADSIAVGKPLLRRFNVPKPRRVGIVETELHDAQLGKRLAQMFSDGNPCDRLRIFGGMKEFTRAHSMDERLKLVRKWSAQEGIEALFLDIASDFFRGPNDSPSDERAVASFFEQLRDMHLTCAVVRHDHKPRIDDMGDGNSNNRIRGSGEWKEDPEVILWLAREDRRTNQVALEVGKLRYGSKPEPMKPWFDAGPFRLTLLPPVIAVLEGGRLTRKKLLEQSEVRFGLSPRKVDEMTNEMRAFLHTSQDGHEKAFELDFDAIAANDEDPHGTEVWRSLVGSSRTGS